ncbi:unnamed protein product [Ixodes pacificus]
MTSEIHKNLHNTQKTIWNKIFSRLYLLLFENLLIRSPPCRRLRKFFKIPYGK